MGTLSCRFIRDNWGRHLGPQELRGEREVVMGERQHHWLPHGTIQVTKEVLGA